MSTEFFDLHILSVVDVFLNFTSLHTKKDVAQWWRAISNKDKHSSNPSRQCIIHHTGIWIIYLYRSLNIYSICIFCQEQAWDVVSLLIGSMWQRGEKTRSDMRFWFCRSTEENDKIKEKFDLPPSLLHMSSSLITLSHVVLQTFYANVFSVLLDFLLRLIKKGIRQLRLGFKPL